MVKTLYSSMENVSAMVLAFVFLGSTPGSTESSWSYRRLSYADMSNILGIGEGHGDIIFIIVGFIR